MQVYGCVNVYQDAAFLTDCLNALRRVVNRVVVADGPYKAFPHHGLFLSNDGTLEIANRLADEVIVCNEVTPWENEVVKRNSYLIGEDGDWYFVVDADEMVEGKLDMKMLTPEAIAYRVKISKTFKTDRSISTAMRLFQHTPGIQYKYAHTLLHTWRDGYICPEPIPEIDGVQLRHRKDERTLQRAIDKSEYYEWLQEEERDARKRFKI